MAFTSWLKTGPARLTRKHAGGKRRVKPLRFDTLEDRRLLIAGALDPTFSGDGFVTTDLLGAAADFAQDVAIVQDDGKIVVVAISQLATGPQSVVARYGPDGSLDAGFGAGGIVTLDNDHAFDVAVQADGKIVVVGSARTANGREFAVFRLNRDGALDGSFGGDGSVTTSFPYFESFSSAFAQSVALQAGGKIVVAGYRESETTTDFAVARYNADGSLDTTFDGDGKVSTNLVATTEFGGTIITSSAFAGDVAVQPDGKVVVVGFHSTFIFDQVGDVTQTDGDFALVRYNADGSLDTAFDGDGIVIANLGTFTNRAGNSSNLDDVAQGMTLQPDGKIVVVGFSASDTGGDFATVRFNPDGAFDTGFDGDGIAISDFGTTNEGAFGVALQADGKLVVAGRTDSNSARDVALVRYNPDGSLDASFGTSGVVISDFGSVDDFALGVAIQADRRIVVVGYSNRGATKNDILVARYLGDNAAPIAVTSVADLQPVVSVLDASTSATLPSVTMAVDPGTLQAVLDAVAALSVNPAGPVIDIVLNLAPGIYSGATISVPPGVRLTLVSTLGSMVFQALRPRSPSTPGSWSCTAPRSSTAPTPPPS